MVYSQLILDGGFAGRTGSSEKHCDITGFIAVGAILLRCSAAVKSAVFPLLFSLFPGRWAVKKPRLIKHMRANSRIGQNHADQLQQQGKEDRGDGTAHAA